MSFDFFRLTKPTRWVRHIRPYLGPKQAENGVFTPIPPLKQHYFDRFAPTENRARKTFCVVGQFDEKPFSFLKSKCGQSSLRYFRFGKKPIEHHPRSVDFPIRKNKRGGSRVVCEIFSFRKKLVAAIMVSLENQLAKKPDRRNLNSPVFGLAI